MDGFCFPLAYNMAFASSPIKIQVPLAGQFEGPQELTSRIRGLHFFLRLYEVLMNEDLHQNLPWPQRVKGHHNAAHLRWAAMQKGHRYIVLFRNHSVGESQ